MTPLSRDTHDATHSLFVLDRPDLPSRFLFVDERTGETITFRALTDGSGATVARQPGGTFVRLTVPPGPERFSTTIRREADGERSAVARRADGGLSFDVDGVAVSARWHEAGRLEMQHDRTADRIVVQPNGNDVGGGSSAYDMWMQSSGPRCVTALSLVVEALILNRLFRTAPVHTPPPQDAP